MCEWLCSAEWSDVQILCGGRSFNAHKAVLASVSTFLRRIFLSCSIDEQPAFIVLPEFDMEAMSSVLYYIYNGEVSLHKSKLRLFLDIIQAMQIYIDCQYLPKLFPEEDSKNCLNSNLKSSSKTKDIFTLALNTENNTTFFNIKKRSGSRSLISQYQQSEDFHDKNIRCLNESELCRSPLGNLKSPYGDRQRNSFLRDLFIETYPRNGNVNGPSEGVLAISNECYHSPTSVLSANANGKHLNVNDASPTICKESTNDILYVPHHKRLQNCDEITTVNTHTKCSTYSRNKVYNFSSVATEDVAVYSQLLPEMLPTTNQFSACNIMSSDISKSILDNLKTDDFPIRESSTSNKSRAKITKSSAKVIFNQVLECPWSSRYPNNYRPFRRKDKVHDWKVTNVNDNNNNIEASTKLIESEKNTFQNHTSPEISSSGNRDIFQCSYCNQVLTSSESLAAHLRRHSTNARYSCSECGKTFSQLRNFKYHMSIHRGTREFAATCTVCGKYFNDRGYLSSHMKIHRNRKEYKCSQCPKSFNQRVAYNMHVRIHTGVKPHVCEECGKAFSRKMLLKQHQRTHSGERPYACAHCDKRFADRSNMTLHLRLHTGVKPFSCSMCPKSFTKKHHLKSHLNFHTGSKPYSCPRCKLSFTQSSNMRTHLKKCTAPHPTDEQNDNV